MAGRVKGVGDTATRRYNPMHYFDVDVQEELSAVEKVLTVLAEVGRTDS